MALSRLCLRSPSLLHKSLLDRLPSPPPTSLSISSSAHLLHAQPAATAGLLALRRQSPFRGLVTAARSTSSASAPQSAGQDPEKLGDDTSGRHEVAVSQDSDSTPRRTRGGGRSRSSLWRNPRDLIPFGGGFLTPAGISSAVWQTTENLNRLLRNLSPSHFFRRMKEEESSYKLQFEVPGLSKDDLKVRVEDNFLVITGERKEEEEGTGGSSADEEEEEEDYWMSRSYGYYNTSLMLPEDAKVDEIKAEVKHGVLYVTIPRTGERKRDVREVKIR